MPTENQSTPTDFAQIIADEKSAAAALSETLQEQNAVFLNFCSTLTNNVLKAMGELNAMELAVAANAAKQELSTAKETATQNIQPAASPTPTSAANSEAAPKSMVQPNASMGGDNDISAAFVSAIGTSMHNAVTAQQQMYILAEASTTEVISTIISMATATLGVAVHNKEQ